MICSIGWKALVLAFPLIGKWVAWRIGDGRSVQIVEDPWAGVGEDYKLPSELIRDLNSKSIFMLVDVYDGHDRVRSRGGWKSASQLGFAGEKEEEWNRKDGSFSTKIGYEAAVNSLERAESRPWWDKIWKISAPLKTIITLWLALSNKLLTWDNLRKRGFQGPGICVLCNFDEESISHIFCHCTYAGYVWKSVAESLNRSLEKNVLDWWNDRRKTREHKSLPSEKSPRILSHPAINREHPWVYFDGASQGYPPLGGAGGVIHFSDNRKWHIKFAPGHASNSKVELAALWAILMIASENHVKHLQCFGDSKMAIDWANGKIQINAPHLQHLLLSIKELLSNFEQIQFSHVYRELNFEADKLSKLALALPPGLIDVEGQSNDHVDIHYVMKV